MFSLPVVLASASLRRLDLLRSVGLEPAVRPADVDERRRPGEDPVAMVERLARNKRDAVAQPGELVLAADTVVVLDGEVLGKPGTSEVAVEMLKRLSGRSHQVVTGVAVVGPGGTASTAMSTEVAWRTLSNAEVDAYVATGEPLDKAGGYGIQGGGGVFVDSLVGSRDNVVGLPVAIALELLASVEVADDPWRR
ncbi:MAG: nucleoside triphosphate pyrophosphatase [Actinomycetota bacterium]|nr:nucleoside triphosphate pyrophosphatase [Actinomycetota bacterium]MEE2957681.1 nucleoside triphosphate pyrophosphatase [Actinomycetota bacterium]